MTPRLVFAAMILPALLAACVQRPPAPVPADPVPATCDAEGLRHLVGQNISILAAMTFPGPMRVIGPDTAVTADFRPDRLNLVHDRAGTIVDVGCY